MSQAVTLESSVVVPGAEHIRGRLTPERLARVLARVQTAREPRPRTRLVLAVGVSLGAAAAVVSLQARSPEPVAELVEPVAAPAQAGQTGTITLSDGSVVRPLVPDTELQVDEDAEAQVRMAVTSGAGRFEVKPRARRTFQVSVGDVTVHVLGTVFSVTRANDRALVEVERGRVEVRWPGGRDVLAAGGTGLYPPDEDREPPPRTWPPPTTRRRASRSAPPGKRAVRWREHAESGEFARAYELLKEAPGAVAPDVAELLLAADAARLSGHPEAAVPYLRRLIGEHPRDPRASLAAFTLGRLLMLQLGQPGPAADAFATARRLSPSSSLSQDALAREVEAARRAGDTARARRLAELYLARYPGGRRSKAVRQHGGLD